MDEDSVKTLEATISVVVDLIQKVEDVKRLTPPELKVYLELLEHLVKKMFNVVGDEC